MFLIFPNDRSTEFLKSVVDKAEELISNLIIIKCSASDESYSDAIEQLKNISKGETVIFIGHGCPTKLYGGENKSFSKKELISLKNVSLFKDVKLILMACNSSDFIRSSRKMRNFSEALGFGLLPSDMNELAKNKKIRELNLTELEINKFKEILIDLFSRIIDLVANFDKSIEELKFFVSTYISVLINNLIGKGNMTNVAKLLFYVRKELTSG